MIEQFGFTSPREVIAALFLLSGLVFFVGSAIGMLRLPDFYSRIHASGNSETLGCTLSFIGLMIYEGPTKAIFATDSGKDGFCIFTCFYGESDRLAYSEQGSL